MASILAVGTEVTSGQIINTNAAWLANQLEDLGIEVRWHLAVPDDRPTIRRALEIAARESHLIFVTGGLGPTTDDFTREVVAEHLDLPLEYHEQVFNEIEHRLKSVGAPVFVSHKQQGYFPAGSRRLRNSAGTADAFEIVKDQKRYFVLPGPPRELEAIWKDHLLRELESTIPETARLRLLRLDCIGKTEAEIAEITETALQGSGLKLGYRIHRPYVEVKVWAPYVLAKETEKKIEELKIKLGEALISQDGHDVVKSLLEILRPTQFTKIHLVDACTAGMLSERFGPWIRQLHRSIHVETRAAPIEASDSALKDLLRTGQGDLVLAIAGLHRSGSWGIGLIKDGISRTSLFPPRPHFAENLDRHRRYAVERAAVEWQNWVQLRTISLS